MIIQAFCEVTACLRRFADLRKKHLFGNPRVQRLGEPSARVVGEPLGLHWFAVSLRNRVRTLLGKPS